MGRLSDRLGAVPVAGADRPALYFSHHLGEKNRAARWSHRCHRLRAPPAAGVWLFGRRGQPRSGGAPGAPDRLRAGASPPRAAGLSERSCPLRRFGAADPGEPRGGPGAALGARPLPTDRTSGAENRLPKPRACRGEALNLRATFAPCSREPLGGRAGAALPGGLPVLRHLLLLLLLPGKRR